LPAGAWRNLWSDDVRETRGELQSRVALAAPGERVPVLVRSRSIVPLDDGFADGSGPCAIAGDPAGADPSGSVALDHRARLLAFHCWAGSDGTASGLCIDDSGDGYGPTRRDEMRLDGAVNVAGAVATLDWHRSGDYPPPTRVRVVLHGYEALRVLADGEEIGATENGAIECAPFDRLEFEGLAPVAE
jgi:hypothetical protein